MHVSVFEQYMMTGSVGTVYGFLSLQIFGFAQAVGGGGGGSGHVFDSLTCFTY